MSEREKEEECGVQSEEERERYPYIVQRQTRQGGLIHTCRRPCVVFGIRVNSTREER